MADRQTLADALARAAREISSPRDLDSTLEAIVETARTSLTGVDHVGISISYRDGRIETKAGTDQLVWELDRVQYELGEGPCVYAIESADVVVANNLRREQKWPGYVPFALEKGIVAQMGLRLYTEQETLGGLNLYSTHEETIDPGIEHTAELFAIHAALALGHAKREDGLNTALQTRKVIGQAIGMVMERFQLDEERAFQYLTRVSQHSNIKLRDVAEELVQQGNERGTRQAVR